MKPDHIDERLDRLRSGTELNVDIPEAVELRMEEILGKIRAEAPSSLPAAGKRRKPDRAGLSDGILQVNGQAGSHSIVPGRFRRLRRLAAITVAGVLLLGMGMAGLGYMSSAFAESMRSVPVIGSLFSLYGDRGMQAAVENGLVQPVAVTETLGDTTISVRNVIYDGARIVLEVQREGDGEFYSRDLRNPEPGELTSVEAYWQEQQLMPSWRPAGEHSVLVSMDRFQSGLTSPFTLGVTLTVAGVEQPFRFDVPVKINAESVVIEKPNMPDTLANRGFVVDKIIVTPVTTQVFFHLRPKAEDTANTFVHPDDFDMSAARDDQGRVYPILGGQGDPETESGSKQYYIFEPVNKAASALKLYFNVAGGPDGKPYTIEMQVPLPDRQR
ncbi:DUF4179 domain-containing protein [Paenibacillus lycopersici]|uniref:DUF4179 domain-containing protein n=1 Tax=Paenibacillus lycopersici TaxID=2704462 RepID=A0A6C0G3R7_9BACL|nr:DUF4179 domain-containing protein [Paenibacillus lycopersici]QHT61340.1 DUF4179 domain-containing protein [Paenibacillus lycopersici]